MVSEDSALTARLSDMSGLHPADLALQSLLGVVSAKLDLCRRLPIICRTPRASAPHDAAGLVR